MPAAARFLFTQPHQGGGDSSNQTLEADASVKSQVANDSTPLRMTSSLNQYAGYQLAGLIALFALIAIVFVTNLDRCLCRASRRGGEDEAADTTTGQDDQYRMTRTDPLPPEVMNELPRTSFGSLKWQARDRLCAICLMEYEEGEEVLLLPCKHSFHTECVTLWFRQHSTCPTCRFCLRTNTHYGWVEPEGGTGSADGSEQGPTAPPHTQAAATLPLDPAATQPPVLRLLLASEPAAPVSPTAEVHSASQAQVQQGPDLQHSPRAT